MINESSESCRTAAVWDLPKGKRAGTHSERAVRVGGGRREHCASVLRSPGELEPFLLALECDRVLKERQRLWAFNTLCMLLFAVCSFWLFTENSLRTNACIFIEINWDALIYECTLQRFVKSCISMKERWKSQVYFLQCGSMDTYNHCGHMED